jgi:phenylalanine-4-hydroxylase
MPSDPPSSPEAQSDVLENTLPILDLDHPGASDPEYRKRREHIASVARAFRDDPSSPFPVVDYSPEEDAVWKQCQGQLAELHERHACRAYVEGRRKLALPTDRIPQLGEVSERLAEIEGFRLWPVEGLVLPRIFLRHLERRIMLSTQYIRHPSRPLFTPEPDIVHELLGHAPMFTHRAFAEFSALVGRGARLADDEQIEKMSRLYWFTVEFGLIEEGDEVRAFGAGLLGGIEDLQRAFSGEADLRPFDLEEIVELDYDYNHPQPIYFVIPSFDRLRAEVKRLIASFETAAN